ncbi:unnamed protein product [Parascedosporium putredinis]|uniref:Uncharacterized protein n=1 Tax=Parascedosporium putredinis TaxID=1442378 RepID=A0A9P1H0M9_9PEZI|nr:unnamed protein product [Parascedosporium putredinis]CAI7994093.1 unnamed protein product [Parascedosporium putredinis]
MGPKSILPLILQFLILPFLALAACDYGPDTCLQGYVWREAFAGDHVCVPPSSRTAAKADNAAAASRIQLVGGNVGPGVCKSGFVWRSARPLDRVCVTPATRTRTAQENDEGPFRVVCNCSLPLYTYTQRWFGTAPFCSGSCPAEWTAIRRASSGGGCERSRKGLCINCEAAFGSSCAFGTKVLCESNIASVTQS